MRGKTYFVYILRCADDTLYTGIARDLTRRLEQHNGVLPGGAKYTRGRAPSQLVYSEVCRSRGTAQRREQEIKKLPREAKLALIHTFASKKP